jgi:hypothetical protein
MPSIASFGRRVVKLTDARQIILGYLTPLVFGSRGDSRLGN